MKWFNDSKNTLLLLLFAIALMLTPAAVNADFTFGKPQNLGPAVNSPFEDAGQTISTDALTLYFSSDRPGGAGTWDLWICTRQSIEKDWGPAVNVGSVVNGPAFETMPALSTDGLTLFFSDGVWHNSGPRPGGLGKTDLWVTTRPSTSSLWSIPINLGGIVNSSSHDCSPSISADGLSLFFDSDRGGNVDLWMTVRKTALDPWSQPVNLGPVINSPSYDAFPSISADGLRLFFMSDRTGNYDLYVSSRRSISDSWDLAINLGPAVNSPDVDACPSLSADGTTLFFMSMRSPKIGGLRDLWQVSITPIVDFKGDNKVDLKDFSKLAQYWEQDESSVDMGPMPWGDGTVDIQDVAVLAAYWLKEFGLIAYWKLDETEGGVAQDSVGDKDGTLNGNPIWQPAGGKVGGALEFDGDGDYVSTPFILDPAVGAFSVFAWVKGGGPEQAIISQAGGVNWLAAGTSQGKLMTELKAAGRFGTPLFSEVVIIDGQWHRVGLTWDGSTRTLYVDGVEAAKGTQGTLVGSTGGLYIGAAKILSRAVSGPA